MLNPFLLLFPNICWGIPTELLRLSVGLVHKNYSLAIPLGVLA